MYLAFVFLRDCQFVEDASFKEKLLIFLVFYSPILTSISITVLEYVFLRKCSNTIDLCMFSCMVLPSVKAIPLQALTGPEGSRRLRLPDFKTVST
jgi:hypothetical protein